MSAALAALDAVRVRDPEFPALQASAKQYSASAAFGIVERVADRLAEQGVEVLAIAADNSPDWVIADLAARRAQIPVVPVPPFFSAEQLEHVLADSGADAIAADEAGSVSLASFPTRFAAELTPDLTLLRLKRTGPGHEIPPDTAKISYTSGTTGSPKGVCLSQQTMDLVAGSLGEATAGLGIRRHLCLLPLATLLENIAGVYAPLMAGAELALPSLGETGISGGSGVDMARLIDCLNRYQPGSIILLPQLLAGLVGAVEQGAKLPSSLGLVAVGGGVVGKPLLERADRAGFPVYEGYGLTETCSVVAMNTPNARRIGSVGRPLPHCRVRIGEDSEVFAKGACMTGYLGDAVNHGSEIATGDIGHLDRDGFLYIDGRKKNLIITSYGRNLSPEWVEASLTGAPAIAQAAIFGDAMPFIVAVIVPAGDASIQTVEREVAGVNRNLPDYAQVRHWILATEGFSPATGTATTNGRVRRSAIRRRYQGELDACYAGALEHYG